MKGVNYKVTGPTRLPLNWLYIVLNTGNARNHKSLIIFNVSNPYRLNTKKKRMVSISRGKKGHE